MIRTAGFKHLDHSLPVHMSGYKVPAHLASKTERPLQVDRRPRRERREIRQPPCFFEHVKPHIFRVKKGDRQAAAVHRDAVAGRGIRQNDAGGHLQFPRIRPLREGDNVAGFFYDSCEHGITSV